MREEFSNSNSNVQTSSINSNSSGQPSFQMKINKLKAILDYIRVKQKYKIT